jgi:hypothetical protein
MLFLTRDQSHDHAVASGVNPNWPNPFESMAEPPFKKFRVSLAKGTYTPIVIAEQIVDFLPHHAFLLWVTTWGVWPSDEDMYLFYRLRASYGESRLLIDAPGHVFEPNERRDLVTFVNIVLTFGWDAAIIVLERGHFPFVFLSHDEYMSIEGRDIPNEMVEHFTKADRIIDIQDVA